MENYTFRWARKVKQLYWYLEGTYYSTGITFRLYEAVVEPHKLLVKSNDRELRLLEFWESGLCVNGEFNFVFLTEGITDVYL